MGSVSPLIAIYQALKNQQPNAEFFWLATKNGPELKFLSEYNIPTKAIFSGKLRRYFSFQNFFDPLLIFIGFIQSFFFLLKFKPSVVISAGGFVAVPVTWAAWILRRPSIIHQQDIRPGLANKLLAPFANIITVTFERSIKDFAKYSQKTHWVGNPARLEILQGSKDEAIKNFNLDPNLPTVLVMGGGTGSLNLNNLVIDNLGEILKFCQVIHITGGRLDKEAQHPRYHAFEFLTADLKHAYAISDLVVTRAGMSALTEIAALRKPALVIPIPNSHQEDNAVEFFRNNAIMMLQEKNLNPSALAGAIDKLLTDKVGRENLARNLEKLMPADPVQRIIKMIL